MEVKFMQREDKLIKNLQKDIKNLELRIDDKKITGIYKFCIQFVNGGQNVAEACLYNYNNTRPTLKLTLKYTRTGAQKEVTVTIDADMEGGTGGGGDVLQPAT